MLILPANKPINYQRCPPGLISWYKVMRHRRGGSRLYDLAKQYHLTGTGAGITTATWSARRHPGGAGSLDFDATVDTCFQHTSVESKIPMTMCCWMSTDTLAGGQRTACSTGHDTATANHWRKIDNNGATDIVEAAQKDASTVITASSTKTMAIGQWVFASGSWDSGNTRVQFNDEFVETGTGVTLDPQTRMAIGCGVRGTNLVQEFNGQVDDVMCFGRFLSERELIGIWKDTQQFYNPMLNWIEVVSKPPAAVGQPTMRRWGGVPAMMPASPRFGRSW